MGVSIDSSEVRNLQLDLSKVPAKLQRTAPAAVKKTLFDIETDAKVLAPVDTGFLEGSIGTDVDADGLGGGVGPTADYGHYVEGGTSRMAPQPYMGPAFDRRAPGLVDALGDAGEDIL